MCVFVYVGVCACVRAFGGDADFCFNVLMINILFYAVFRSWEKLGEHASKDRDEKNPTRITDRRDPRPIG